MKRLPVSLMTRRCTRHVMRSGPVRSSRVRTSSFPRPASHRIGIIMFAAGRFLQNAVIVIRTTRDVSPMCMSVQSRRGIKDGTKRAAGIYRPGLALVHLGCAPQLRPPRSLRHRDLPSGCGAEQKPPQEPFILVGHTAQVFKLLTGVCLRFAFDVLDGDAPRR